MTISIFNTFASVCYSSIMVGASALSAIIIGGILVLNEIEIYDGIFQIILIISGSIIIASLWLVLLSKRKMK